MNPDYTSTPSSFYGAGGGHSHVCPGARRDPRAQPKLESLVCHPSRTMLRTNDVVEASQLATEERSALAEATWMTIHGTMMVVQVERRRAPTGPTEPEL